MRALQIEARYDDGFVAYVNGSQVATRNAPDELRWNSAATSVNANSDARQFESIVIDSGILKVGRNVLAIQALNNVADRADFLWQGKLGAIGLLADEPAFLTEPTPGLPNIAPTLSLSDAVQFDVAAGFYENPISVSMSIDTPDADIRYTLDGSLPSATNGVEYSAPITIGSSTVVRAVGVRAGFEAREITTASYLFLSDVYFTDSQQRRGRRIPDQLGAARFAGRGLCHGPRCDRPSRSVWR